MKLWGANLTLNQDLDFSLASASTNTWINVRHFLGQKELQGKEEYKKLKQRKKMHYCSFYLCPPSPADKSSWHCLSIQWAIILAGTLVCIPCLCKLLYSHHCPGIFLSSIDGAPWRPVGWDIFLVEVIRTQLAPIHVGNMTLVPGNLAASKANTFPLPICPCIQDLISLQTVHEIQEDTSASLFSDLYVLWSQLSGLNIGAWYLYLKR